MKRCPICNMKKKSSEFYKRADDPSKLGAWCKECTKQRRRDRKDEIQADHLLRLETDPEYKKNHYARCRLSDKRRYDKDPVGRNKPSKQWHDKKMRDGDPTYLWNRYNRHCKREYGIGVKEIERMLIGQQGLCACCLKPIPEMRGNRTLMHVDHCHTSGKVRGLLCHHCNITLGQVETIGMHKIKDYLEDHEILVEEWLEALI